MSGTMRLQALSLRNFRCFRDELLDLSGDVTLIYARNGVGKTAIFDAIELALLGEVARFQDDSPGLEIFSNVYGDGSFHVSLELAVDGQRSEEITVGWDGRQPELKLATGLGWETHRDLLYEFLINNDELRPPRRQRKLAEELFRASILLSQHSMREFVEGDPRVRSGVVSRLAGTAFLKSSSAKAEQVKDEAQRRLQALEDDIRRTEGEVRESLAAIEAHEELALQLKNLVGDAAPAGKVEDALEEVGIGRDLLEGFLELAPDRVVESVDASVDATRVDLEEAMRRARRALEAVVKAADLDKLLAEKEESLGRLGEEERAHAEAVEKAAKLGAQLEERAEGAAKAVDEAELGLEQVRGLVNLERELEDLRKADTAAGDAARPVEEQVAQMSATVDSHEQQVSLLLDEGTAHSTSIAQAEGAIKGLESSLRDQARYLKLSSDRETLAQEQIRVEEQLASLRSATSASQKRLAASVTEEARLTRELAAEQAASERWESLASQLAELVADESCPLCGHEYETRELLREAIDSQLKSIPEKLRTLSASLQASESGRITVASELAGLELKLEPLEAEAKQLETRIQEVDTARGALETLGVHELDPEALKRNLEERRRELEAIRRRHDDLSRQIETLSSARKALVERRNAEQTRANELRGEATLAQRRAKDAASELARLSGDGDEASNKAQEQRSEEGAVESLKAARAGLESAKKELADHRTSVRKLQASHKKASAATRTEKDRISDVRTERAGVQDLFVQAGFEGTPTAGSAAEAIQALGERLAALSGARQVILAHVRDSRLVATDAEQVGARSVLQGREAILSELLERRAALEAAQRQATEWTDVLKREIQTVVAERVTRHRGTIWRLFSGMIPDPYCFDGLEIDEVDGGVELGIKYRGLSTVAGEPKYFLSHAQANVLALAVFFAFAMAQRWSHLITLMLDDPVQHLDDLDSVAFIDTVRACVSGTGGGRQVVMSTCDHDLYILMLRKLGLLEYEGLRVTGITLRDGGSEGPRVNYDFGGPPGRRLFAAAV